MWNLDLTDKEAVLRQGAISKTGSRNANGSVLCRTTLPPLEALDPDVRLAPARPVVVEPKVPVGASRRVRGTLVNGTTVCAKSSDFARQT